MLGVQSVGAHTGGGVLPRAGNVGSVEALAVGVEVEALTLGGGGLVWNIAAVEVEEEESASQRGSESERFRRMPAYGCEKKKEEEKTGGWQGGKERKEREEEEERG